MFRSCALVLAMLALAGCGSVEASTFKATAATPTLPCSLPYGTQVELLSPHPGSRSAAAGNAPLVLVASRDLPTTVTLVATDAKGVATSGTGLERTTKPATAATAAFADPVYYRVTGLGLRAHRHYTISLEDLAQNGCAPFVKIGGDARFST